MKLVTMSLLLFAAPLAVDVTGTWSGSFEGQNAQGDSRKEPALLILKQDGSNVSGTAGPDESERHPIQNGKIDGDKLTFEVVGGKGTISFDLTVSATEITGTMRRSRDGATQTAKLLLKRSESK
jgi:hypothetical protein